MRSTTRFVSQAIYTSFSYTSNKKERVSSLSFEERIKPFKIQLESENEELNESDLLNLLIRGFRK